MISNVISILVSNAKKQFFLSVCILNSVCILYPVCSLQSAFCTDRIPNWLILLYSISPLLSGHVVNYNGLFQDISPDTILLAPCPVSFNSSSNTA